MGECICKLIEKLTKCFKSKKSRELLNDNQQKDISDNSQDQSPNLKINKYIEAPKEKNYNKIIDFDYSLLKSLLQSYDNNNENIILLTTGSYNPIHRMHLEILNIAYNFLLNKEYNIICGFISPSADSYVQYKQPPLIPFDTRCEMIEKAIKEYNNENKDSDNLNNLKIFMHKWEGSHDYFIDFPYVIEEIQNKLNENFKEYKIRLVYVCGMDLYLKCYYSLTKNVIAVDRKPYINNKFKSIPNRFIYLITDKKCEPLSSTLIKEAYKNGNHDIIKEDTFPEVSKMIINYYNENFEK